MLPSEGGGDGEDAAPIDIKSRIAAFSQGAASTSTSSRPAPAVSRVSKPTLRKTPSTSQLLPAWQQHQQQERQKQEDATSSHNTSLKPDSIATTRLRAHTGDDSRLAADSGEYMKGNSPKLGVKGILALYGQQVHSKDDVDISNLQTRTREVSSEGLSTTAAAAQQSSSRPSSMETLRRAVPPPALPPRPKNLLSQTNTGSSDHSVTSNGPSTSAAGASPSSSYVPYMRKGNGNSQLTAGSMNGNDSPALPRRLGTTQSVENLSLDPSANSSQLSSATRKLGSGPKWASSSSGNLTTQGETSRSQSPTIPPAVPPRASTSVTNSPSATSYVPPPPKRTIAAQSPATARNYQRSINAASSYSSSVPSPVISSAMASSAMTSSPSNGYQSRSAKSSLTTPNTSSPILAPPPRHVDTIRRMDTRNLNSTSSSSSLRSAKKEKRKRFKTLQAGAVYARDPGDAEQRYTLLFYRRLKDQQERTGGDSSLLNKRTVVRIWKQSQLGDWFLANVWEAATAADDGGIGRAAFARAMSAIDHELSRRQAERQSR
jgi:hypothetical protein